MAGNNLIENGDFKDVNGESPSCWWGFNDSTLLVHKRETFEGMPCCITQDRAKSSCGPAQDILHAVDPGRKYHFSAYVKLDPSTVPESTEEEVRVQLQFALTSDEKMAYIRVATVQATPANWQRMSGVLVVPPNTEKGAVKRAVLYFGGPPPQVNFLVAAVRLVDEVDQSGNLLRNGDFSSAQNGQPEYWKGFGDARVFIHPEITCEGKRACVATDRGQAFGGLAQNVLAAVELGHRYRFTANLRLAPTMPADAKHKINIKLQYKSIDSKSFSYILIASASGITRDSWTSVKGALNMPPSGHVTPLKSATLYFGNAPTDVSFMVADVSLIDDEPAIEDRNPAKTSTECTDDVCAPVFISYQWDIQDSVKALREKLEKCGLACWMDIGQMGGGDSLYTQIDKGIRGAKVIVCCITSKYAKSENCQREITLADCLKKPIIPLIMDRTVQWPPPGQLSMILAKLLYIDMTGAGGPRDFPPLKLQELMTEIKERL